jgi:hypothetical protein
LIEHDAFVIAGGAIPNSKGEGVQHLVVICTVEIGYAITICRKRHSHAEGHRSVLKSDCLADEVHAKVLREDRVPNQLGERAVVQGGQGGEERLEDGHVRLRDFNSELYLLGHGATTGFHVSPMSIMSVRRTQTQAVQKKAA